MLELQLTTQIAITLWSKSPKKGTNQLKLGVLEHLLNVAACAAEMLELEPPQLKQQLAADLGLNEAEGLPWVLALVALHDIGKATPAFQSEWPIGKKAMHVKLTIEDNIKKIKHGKLTHRLLSGMLENFKWPPALAGKAADAVGCHHGTRAKPCELNIPTSSAGSKPWPNIRQELFRLTLLGVGVNPSITPAATELSSGGFMRLAGLTSVADWLGSSFPLPTVKDESAYIDPKAYFEGARAKAKQLLSDTGWPQFAELKDLPPIEEVFKYIPKDGSAFIPRPLQTELQKALAGVKEPALILVEAPMGEGKTEAALYSYMQLKKAVRHRGMYIALPTQATGNAMYERLLKFLAAQNNKRPVSVQLAHGGSILNDNFQKVRVGIEYKENTESENGKEEISGVRVEEWFTQRKRALLDEFGVGTIDQALLGVLPVSHHFVRLWGLANRVVVLDEVHAYDTYTSELIYVLVSWLRALGSSVIIMSATLPKANRNKLLAAWGVSEIAEQKYPRLTVATASGKLSSAFIPATDKNGNTSRPSKKIQLRALASSTGEIAAKAVALAIGGGCVAVIVNTVQRAQDIQQEVIRLLENQGLAAQTCTGGVKKSRDRVGVLLYHARYPADERSYREQAVLKYLGKPKDGEKSKRPEKFILIATQVAEQSLDFDADVMISDLAPIDLILQRAGRLHRHENMRWGHDEATLYVAGLTAWPQDEMKSAAWGYVYERAILYFTWLELQGKLEINLPEDLDHLVQKVYGDYNYQDKNLNEKQIQEIECSLSKLKENKEKYSSKGRDANVGRPNDFFSTNLIFKPDGDTESVNDDPDFEIDSSEPTQTRLSDESIRVVPVCMQDGALQLCKPLSKTLEKYKDISLTAQTCTLEKSETEKSKLIFSRSLSVSRWDIINALKSSDNHGLGNKYKGWQAHAILRDVFPLELEKLEGDVYSKVFGSTLVTLDSELGLVYKKLK